MYYGMGERGYVLMDCTESDGRPRVEPIHRRNGITSAERYLIPICVLKDKFEWQEMLARAKQ